MGLLAREYGSDIAFDVYKGDRRLNNDDQLVFEYIDPEPYRSGWFAFRTVGSHFAIRDFAVWRPAP